MSGYTTLWTSSSDKEFRELSKHHSLQKRRLGLRMTGIEREHVRQVRRVRTEMREATGLVEQYEKEKEQRARHLLKTFSKVHRKRRAALGWKVAHSRKASTIHVRDGVVEGRLPSISEASSVGGRRDSCLSVFSVTPRPSLTPSVRPNVDAFSALGSRARKTKPGDPRVPLVHFGKDGALPPIQSTARRGSSSSVSSSGSHSDRRSTTRTAGRLSDTGRPSLGDIAGNSTLDHNASTQKGADDISDNGSDSGHPAAKRLMSDRDVRRSRRQVIWTETFPFVYHSVGETVCPRYSLFLRYEHYKVYPEAKPRPSLPNLGKVKQEGKPVEEKKMTFRSLAKTLGMMRSMASRVSDLQE
ncbi:hypothetical protein BaRGS_00023447 [Batillaria attramentaria]|uniref:Uncharacterized protein n=1 Tax=Batillaria attramentaria TaxID=370345 RepID=A0ABD0KDW7_9CAEN